jgi:hypothetical protein
VNEPVTTHADACQLAFHLALRQMPTIATPHGPTPWRIAVLWDDEHEDWPEAARS